VQPNPELLEAQDKALHIYFARYILTRVDLKTFTFSAGSKSRSIDNGVLGLLAKRLLFTMIKNTDFNGSVDTNPYTFRHISEFSLYVNGQRLPSEGLSLDMNHEKLLSWAIGHTLKGPAFIPRTGVYR
jgi:hypothetical protein